MSATVGDHERVAALVFKLARDDVPFGKIESHVRDIEKAPLDEPVRYVDAAEPLGEWARQTASRLLT